MHPRARTEGILTKAIDGELILYDQVRHRAHRLNATAAVVWQNCDGQRTSADLARLACGEMSDSLAEDVVHLALKELGQVGLLCDSLEEVGGVTRRVAIRRVAAAAGLALLPFVTTMMAPTPAEAQSGLNSDLADSQGPKRPKRPKRPQGSQGSQGPKK